MGNGQLPVAVKVAVPVLLGLVDWLHSIVLLVGQVIATWQHSAAVNCVLLLLQHPLPQPPEPLQAPIATVTGLPTAAVI
jgi:hypothetical protein